MLETRVTYSNVKARRLPKSQVKYKRCCGPSSDSRLTPRHTSLGLCLCHKLHLAAEDHITTVKETNKAVQTRRTVRSNGFTACD